MEASLSVDIRSLAIEMQMVDRVWRNELRRGIREAVNKGGQAAIEKAKDNASSIVHSTGRIQDALGLKTSFSVRSAGVTMRANARKAPHARPWEMGSKGNQGRLRHPTFAAVGSERYDDGKSWHEWAARPFFFKAVDETGPVLYESISTAVDDAARAAGFR